MPGENPNIEAAQAEILKQRDQSQDKDLAGLMRQYEDAFIDEVHNFTGLDTKLKLHSGASKEYFNKGKNDVSRILLRVAARGQWLIDHPAANITTSAEGDKTKGGEKSKPVRQEASENKDNIDALAAELKNTMAQYKEKLTVISDVLAKRGTAFEYMTRAWQLEATNAGAAPNIPTELTKAYAAALVGPDGDGGLGAVLKVIRNNPDLPKEFLAENGIHFNDKNLKYFMDRKILGEQQSLAYDEKYVRYFTIVFGKKADDKPTVKFTAEGEKLPDAKKQEILLAMAGIRVLVEEQVEASICPKIAERFWAGKTLLESGNFDAAKTALEEFLRDDLGSMASNLQLKAKKDTYEKRAKEMLMQIEAVSGGNKYFFDAQKLAQGGDIIGAKKLLKKYVAGHEKVEEGKPNFLGSAKELLKRIALVQVADAREKFKIHKEPSEKIIVHEKDSSDPMAKGKTAVEKYNPEYGRYHKYGDALDQIEKGIGDGKYLDFTDAYNALAAAPGANFDQKDEFNMLADQVTLDKGKDGKEGLLELARKYREKGKLFGDPKYLALAEECFKQYFGQKLEETKQKYMTIADIRKKYDSSPTVQAAITDEFNKISGEVKKKYDEKVAKDPEWGKGHSWAEYQITARNGIADEVYSGMRNEETLKQQNGFFNADPKNVGDPADHAVWSEFMNMKGMHGQGKSREPLALSDEEVGRLVKDLPVDIAIIAASGALAAATAGAASGLVLEAGLSVAEREVLAFGVRSGLRQLAAYTVSTVVETTVFTASHSVMTGVRIGEFSITNLNTFGKEWLENLKVMGGLGLVGRASAALKLGKLSSFGMEMTAMGTLSGGHLGINDFAMVLGLKVGHAAPEAFKSKGAKKANEGSQSKPLETAVPASGKDISGFEMPLVSHQVSLESGSLKKSAVEHQQRQLEALKKIGNTAFNFDPATDPHYLSLDSYEKREPYLAQKIKELKSKILIENTDPELQKKIMGMADRQIGGDFRNGGKNYEITGKVTDTSELPANWRENLLYAADFVPGKSFLLRLKPKAGESGEKYAVINAGTVADGVLLNIMDKMGSISWKENSQERKEIYDQTKKLSTEIDRKMNDEANERRMEAMREENERRAEAMRLEGEIRTREREARLAKSRDAFDENARKASQPQKAMKDNPYLKRLLDFGREVRKDSALKDLPPEERQRVIAEKIRAESDKIRAEVGISQKKVADIGNELLKKSKENPNLTAEELIEEFKKQAVEKGLVLPDSEVTQIQNSIKSLMAKKKAVAEYTEKYKNDPGKLFKMMFGFEPHGEVKLIPSAFSINFQVMSFEDFHQIHKNTTNQEVHEGSMVFNGSAVNIQELSGMVNIIRGDKQSYDVQEVIVHEEQHAVNGHIRPYGLYHVYLKILAENAQNTKSMDQICSSYLDFTLKRAQNELSAYISQGFTNKNDVVGVLTRKGGAYDYWGDFEKLVQNKNISSAEIGKLMDRYREFHNERVRQMAEVTFTHLDPLLTMITPARQMARKGKETGAGVEIKLDGYRQQFPTDKANVFVVRAELPGGRVVAHNHQGEIVVYESKEIYDLAKEKLSPLRLGQETVDGTTTVEKVDSLKKAAEVAKPLFDAMTFEVAQKIGAVELHNASIGGQKGEGVSLKDPGQAAKKIDGAFEGKAEFMTDMLRGTIVCRDIPLMNQAIIEIMKNPDVVKISIQNRINWDGCNDMLVNIKMKNGHVAELQLHVPEIKNAIGGRLMVPETLLGPQEFAFSANEESIVAGLKIDEEGRRTLRGHIELPKFGEPTSTHIIYEIMRSMPRPELRSPAQQALYVRLNGMMLAVHNYAMSQYTARTGLDFKSDFNL